MYKFGATSKKKLLTCHKDIQKVMNAAIKIADFSIICGHRTEADQMRAFRSGASNLQFPYSRHNSYPSQAVDVAPWPIVWEGPRARERFYYVGGIIIGVAESMGVDLRHGGDWNRDREILDEKGLSDLPHFELFERRTNSKGQKK